MIHSVGLIAALDIRNLLVACLVRNRMVGVWQAVGAKSAGDAGAPCVWLLAESADLSGSRNFPKE